MTAHDKIKARLAFSHSAFAHDQHSDSEDIDELRMERNGRSKRGVENIADIIGENARNHRRRHQRNIVFFRCFLEVIRRLLRIGENYKYRFFLKKSLSFAKLFLHRKSPQIIAFALSEKLDPVFVEMIRESRYRKPDDLDLAFGQLDFFHLLFAHVFKRKFKLSIFQQVVESIENRFRHGKKFQLELFKKTQIACMEMADVVDSVFHHRESLDAAAESESRINLRVYAAVSENLRVDHSAA